jgi:hypothetical protein
MNQYIRIAAALVIATSFGCKKTDNAKNQPAAKPAEPAGCAPDALKDPEHGFCVTAPGYKIDSVSKQDDGTIDVHLWKPGNNIVISSSTTWTMPAKLSDVLGAKPTDTVEEGETPAGAKWRSVKSGTVQTVTVYLKGPKAIYECGVSGSDIKETFDVCKSIAAL